ncbi:MAG: bifunctional phosphoribosylaminoimidazolecarboxamide formyltransferase/IMP cyclohydrolase [Candidatus Marinimicrobia bacterium]|nr:bifunctional phosphoribosylaminoimidazolecarboxamide formyltransferase/IMP cyclohydrolase [Candidatus Neomarinimicrobiota bacterium]MCF7827680.1 bifunctional phosphoribosylaminoimidazolecarboxamide formyltransferase/IMP cyclohydrolase [Candidatus Neomarinimicrobiota bacterium]MCF7881265.1 bifunctional phosphoribosylaminoimidazolecarboxamide formyltransferase/IMP cyclohydrolase [Candidatus Neomarinimicrobiota bacterium]
MELSGAVLISVYHKPGVEKIATAFVEHGAEIYSTGGTASYLREQGIEVTDVSDVTGFPEILDGRVKTLHPKIFGGILADNSNEKHNQEISDQGIKPIIGVVVNFYPFTATVQNKDADFQEIIENIDIGGPSMLRAAAKNHQSVLPICHESQYDLVSRALEQSNADSLDALRLPFAKTAFAYTMQYEQSIAEFFSEQSRSEQEAEFPKLLPLNFSQSLSLRYGENPHQDAAYFDLLGNEPFDFSKRQLQGKPLSYNNLMDLDAALRIIGEFQETACVIIKHSNPCGFAYGSSTEDAYRRAVTTDPVSYFGGIVGFNEEVDGATASALTESFLECIVAPDFSDEAIKIFKSKKNLRIIRCYPGELSDGGYEIRPALTGYLVQQRDPQIAEITANAATKRHPTDTEMKALKLGWRLVKHTKSNAIVFTNQEQAVGVGAGQMSRVDSVKIAIRKAEEAGLSLEDASMASDAFFPFPDAVEIAYDAGIRSVIQPGGSIRDDKVIAAADERDMAMIMTGNRHFKH